MQEVRELWPEEIGVMWLRKFLWRLEKKIRWNRTLRSQKFSRSEIRYLYVFAFQMLEVEVVLQRLKFLLQLIQECD